MVVRATAVPSRSVSHSNTTAGRSRSCRVMDECYLITFRVAECNQVTLIHVSKKYLEEIYEETHQQSRRRCQRSLDGDGSGSSRPHSCLPGKSDRGAQKCSRAGQSGRYFWRWQWARA